MKSPCKRKKCKTMSEIKYITAVHTTYCASFFSAKGALTEYVSKQGTPKKRLHEAILSKVKASKAITF